MATTTNFYSNKDIDLALTCVPDIDALILLNLAIYDLNKMCNMNKYLNYISQGDYFWKRKVVIDFGPDYPLYKPKHETFKEQYKYLFNIYKGKLFDEAYEQGRMDAIYYMNDHGFQPTSYQAGIAAEHGNIELLKLLKQWGTQPSPYLGANGAAQNGHTEVLKLLKSWNIPPTRYTIESAAKGGYVEVFKLFKSWANDPNEPDEITRDILFTETVVNMAAQNGHVEVVKLLKSWGILPGEYAADYAAGGGHVEVIKLLDSWGIFITQRGVNCAARFGHVEVLKLLKSWNILPARNGANGAATNGHIEALKFMKSLGVLPTGSGTYFKDFSEDHFEVEELLRSWGIYSKY